MKRRENSQEIISISDSHPSDLEAIGGVHEKADADDVPTVLKIPIYLILRS